MTSTATAVARSRISSLDQGQGRGDPLHIVCPTYWYPQHADDTQATYVHDINRHLVRRGHRVVVVTPQMPRSVAATRIDPSEHSPTAKRISACLPPAR